MAQRMVGRPEYLYIAVMRAVVRVCRRQGVNIQALGLGVAVGDRGYVLAAGGVLPGRLCVALGRCPGRDRWGGGGGACRSACWAGPGPGGADTRAGGGGG